MDSKDKAKSISYFLIVPYYAKLADEISEEWTERFKIELQPAWENEIG